MSRVLLAAVVLTGPWLAARADETTVRLTVQPMAAPRPALRYMLLPEVRELHPGNRAQWFVRCFAEQRSFFFTKEAVEQREHYRALPLAKLRSEHLEDYGRNALRQADWGARLDAVDWQVGQRVRADGLDVQLPELPPLRILGQALQVRFRAQVAEGRFDEAIGTAKTMFALAHDLGKYPALAGNRVGLAIADLAVDTLEEMVQQPGCPNLYWALTDLPRPLVDLRQGVQGDRVQMDLELGRIRSDSPMSHAELDQVVSRLSGRLGYAREQAGLPPRNVRARLQARAQDAAQVRAACRHLAEADSDNKAATAKAAFHFLQASMKYQKFPALQVVLLDEKHAYETQRDETMKLLALAPWQIETLRHAAGKGHARMGVFASLTPDVLQVRWAQGRLERRLALLRYVGGLRLYAAAHGGKLPEKLADVGVPLPDDPFTGKPFRYERHGSAARLDSVSRQGTVKNPGYNIHYEITVR